ncbi:MAG: hypothetical protein A4E29_01135 [Methanomassiliicoccales archaeon PtaB.Bin134]|nr:MAG: hypothetical protein A4E29_01135 [Methanomassiliicoccales archaeon PtaB.Bin134]
MTHSLMGASILMLGARAAMLTSNLTWSFPLAVQPWAMKSAPSFFATSTNSLAMSGRAIAVDRG